MIKEFDDLTEAEQSIIQEYWNEVDSNESIEHILDGLVFEGTVKEFIDDYLSNIGIDIPDWIYINYKNTWEFSLSYDYIKTSNYIFSNY